LTGWLIGHPDSCKLFKTAVLWNGVLNIPYMAASTDIPDWIVSCCLNKSMTYEITPAMNDAFFKASPISVIENVITPSLFLVGGSDKRVTPH
jgi:hypothetical protein